MPLTEAPVLVTGASGFIAAHVIRELLARGYRVRGTVRSLARARELAYLRELPGAAERLELVEADLMREGSFDAAAEGVHHVMHTASPYVLHAEDPQRDLVDPAVKGTRTVLASCKKAGTVKRVVLTSSMAAITDCCMGARSGNPRKRRASSGVQSMSMLTFMGFPLAVPAYDANYRTKRRHA